MPSDQEFKALKREVEDIKQRELEADMALRARLLAIVESLEKKHSLGRYARPMSFVLSADQQPEIVEGDGHAGQNPQT
jgi:hypothetical protein